MSTSDTLTIYELGHRDADGIDLTHPDTQLLITRNRKPVFRFSTRKLRLGAVEAVPPATSGRVHGHALRGFCDRLSAVLVGVGASSAPAGALAALDWKRSESSRSDAIGGGRRLEARSNDGQPSALQAQPNVVTIPGHPGDDVPAGTLKSIFKAAGLEKNQ